MVNGKKVTEISPSAVSLLQQDWKMGFLPAKVIALKFGVDFDDLIETAKREGWTEGETTTGLQQQIQEATLEATVDRVVSEADVAEGDTAPKLIKRDRTATVKQFGMIVAGVEAEHRAVIKRARLYVTTLLNELEELVGPLLEKERIQALARMIGDGDPEFVKALTTRPDAGDLVGGLKVLDRKAQVITKLTWAMKDLLTLERAAYGLDKHGGAVAGYDELLEEIHQRKKR